MNLKQVPLEIENIILGYVAQLEHSDKQRKLNKEIRSFNRYEYNYRVWCYAWEFSGKRKYYWR